MQKAYECCTQLEYFTRIIYSVVGRVFEWSEVEYVTLPTILLVDVIRNGRVT